MGQVHRHSSTEGPAEPYVLPPTRSTPSQPCVARRAVTFTSQDHRSSERVIGQFLALYSSFGSCSYIPP